MNKIVEKLKQEIRNAELRNKIIKEEREKQKKKEDYGITYEREEMLKIKNE